MKLKSSLTVISIVAVLVSFDCSHPTQTTGNGSGTGNALVGNLYQSDGITPAKGIRVYIRPKKSLADTGGIGLSKKFATFAATDSVLTDSSGRYAFDTTLDTGTYVIEGANGNNAVLIDSVPVKNKSVPDTLQPDTLKPVGAIKGVIKLSEGGDPRKVFVLAFGIDRFARVNTDGSFKFSTLAEGKYDLRLISSLDNYGVLDTVNIPVKSADTTNMDTISLPFTGIPTPKNVSINYDTLKQIVTLSWSKPDSALVKGFNVYRRNVDSNSVLKQVNTNPITDTIYNDSTGIQDQTYEYRIAAVDKNATEGTKSAGVSVKVVGAFQYLSVFGSQGTLQGQYSNPIGVEVLSDKVYILDRANDSGKVIVYDTNGRFVKELKGFYKPIGITIKSNLSFYIQQESYHISLFDSSGKSIADFGGSGSDTGKFNQSGLWQIAISSNSVLYTNDYGNNRIQVFDSMGTYLRKFSIAQPLGIAFIDANKIFISYDPGVSAKSAICDTNGSILSTMDFFVSTPVITTNGNIIGAKNDNTIAVYSQNGKLLSEFGTLGNGVNQFQYIRDIALLPNNKIIIADNQAKSVKIYRIPSQM